MDLYRMMAPYDIHIHVVIKRMNHRKICIMNSISVRKDEKKNGFSFNSVHVWNQALAMNEDRLCGSNFLGVLFYFSLFSWNLLSRGPGRQTFFENLLLLNNKNIPSESHKHTHTLTTRWRHIRAIEFLLDPHRFVFVRWYVTDACDVHGMAWHWC